MGYAVDDWRAAWYGNGHEQLWEGWLEKCR